MKKKFKLVGPKPFFVYNVLIAGMWPFMGTVCSWHGTDAIVIVGNN